MMSLPNYQSRYSEKKIVEYIICLMFDIIKGKDQYWQRPNFKNEMEALITNHVKEYVLTNT